MPTGFSVRRLRLLALLLAAGLTAVFAAAVTSARQVTIDSRSVQTPVAPGGVPGTPVSPGSAVGPSSIAPGSPPVPGTGVITGVVIDGTDGVPIAGAIVMLGAPGRGVPGVQSRQITDGQGRFAFVGVPVSARLPIAASRPGYVAEDGEPFGAPTTDLSLSDGQWLSQVKLALRKLASVSGTVIDERGEPVAGVAVRAFVRLQIAGRDHLASAPSTITDDRGQYRFANLPPGRYVICVPSVQASVPASTPERSIANLPGPPPAAMEATGTASGRSAIDAGFGTRLVAGPYPIPPPPSGSTTWAYPISFHPAAASINDATTVALGFGDARTDINVILAPVTTAFVSGRLEGGPDARGGMTVRLLSAGLDELGSGTEAATALVDTDGSFRFANVPLGNYVLALGTSFSEYRFGKVDFSDMGRFRSPGLGPSSSRSGNVEGYPNVSLTQTTMGASQAFFSDRVAVTVGSSGVSDVVLRLRPPLTISGMVRLEFDPAVARPAQTPVVVLGVEPADGGTSGSSTTMGINWEGSPDRDAPTRPFRFEALAPGNYVFRAMGGPWRLKSVLAGGRDYLDAPLAATDPISNLEITLTMQSATISGTVASDRGVAAGGLTIGVFPADRNAWRDFGASSPRMRSGRTDDGGRYRIGQLPAGDYFVTVIPPSRRNDWRSRDFFESVASSAARVSVDWGQSRDQALRTEAR